MVERKWWPGEMDRFIWPCEKCGNKRYETEARFDDPGNAVAKPTNAIKSNPKLASCKRCNAILEL